MGVYRGSAIAGDDSLSAAIREVKEELGLEILPENGKCIYSEVRYNDICDVWLFKQDFDLNDVVLQEYETVNARYAGVDEIIHMMENNEFYKFDYFVKLFAHPHNENIVVISEKEYNELEKAKRNNVYLEKISRSKQQILDGKIVTKTFEELEEMAK